MRIDIWSDIVCPFCYIGKRHLEQALETQARSVGLEYHLGTTRTGNTFDVHRVIHLAAAHGLADAAHERFMHAHFTDNEAVNDHEVLVRLATEVGLEEQEVREVLAGDAYAADVRADAERARAYGARGVPFFVLADAVGVSGAQPVEVFTQALEQAWATANPLQMVSSSSADATCEGDSCQI